jgi:hypothetical protein
MVGFKTRFGNMVTCRAFPFQKEKNSQPLKMYYWKTLQLISKINVFIKPMLPWNFWELMTRYWEIGQWWFEYSMKVA